MKELKKAYSLKLGWKIITSKSLWSEWMRNKYSDDNFWVMKIDNNASGVWNTILKGRDELKKIHYQELCKVQANKSIDRALVEWKHFNSQIGMRHCF